MIKTDGCETLLRFLKGGDKMTLSNIESILAILYYILGIIIAALSLVKRVK